MMHGYNPTDRFLPYLSWTEIAELPDKANTVTILPTGATEQHGPHLPCAVDSVIAAGVVGHALARLPDTVKAYAMSAITYGKSDEHLDFPGTVTLTEVGESVYRSGFRKLLIVDAHGGQPQVMEMAARELRLREGDFIVVPTSAWRVPHAQAVTCPNARRNCRCTPGTPRRRSCWRWRRTPCTLSAPSATTRRSFRAPCCSRTGVRPAPGQRVISVRAV